MSQIMCLELNSTVSLRRFPGGRTETEGSRALEGGILIKGFHMILFELTDTNTCVCVYAYTVLSQVFLYIYLEVLIAVFI